VRKADEIGINPYNAANTFSALHAFLHWKLLIFAESAAAATPADDSTTLSVASSRPVVGFVKALHPDESSAAFHADFKLLRENFGVEKFTDNATIAVGITTDKDRRKEKLVHAL
jgi:hypothetical protein